MNYLTPEQFGAVGDNITDDTAAIQAMFDSVGTVKTTQKHTVTVCQFSPGAIYKTSASLKIQQYNIWVYGSGAYIRNTSISPALLVDYDDSVNSAIGIHIIDLGIQSAGGGIYAKSAPQLKIKGCKFKDLYSDGQITNCVVGNAIRLEGCVSYQIIDNDIDHPSGIGIYVKTLNKTWNAGAGGPIICESQGGVIENNRIFYSGSIGILVVEGGGHKIIRNDIEACNGGCEIRSSYDFTIEDNYFESNAVDITTRNLTDLVPTRTIKGGRILSNQCESITGISLVAGEDQIVAFNRLSGNNYINTSCVRTKWSSNVEQGALYNYSTTTVFSL